MKPQVPETRNRSSVYKPEERGGQTDSKIISRFPFISHCNHIILGIILFEFLLNEGVNQHILRQEFTG